MLLTILEAAAFLFVRAILDAAAFMAVCFELCLCWVALAVFRSGRVRCAAYSKPRFSESGARFVFLRFARGVAVGVCTSSRRTIFGSGYAECC